MPTHDDEALADLLAQQERLARQNEALIAQNARLIALLERAVDWMGRLGGVSFDERDRTEPAPLDAMLDDDTPFEA